MDEIGEKNILNPLSPYLPVIPLSPDLTHLILELFYLYIMIKERIGAR
jgi:hypothetical protein